AGLRTRTRACAANRAWGLAETGSSDAHHLPHVGKGWTEFEGESPEDLRAALLERRTAARMVGYPSLREVGIGRTALGLAWGYTATPRKMLRLRRERRA
ncbi:MAG: PHP-associated domain-containing protein, partial [Hyphomicrobiales bacterium]